MLATDAMPNTKYNDNEPIKLAVNTNTTQKESSKTDKLEIGKKELSDKEKKVIEELKAVDQKVKAHEQAHLAAGGNLVRGGASYQYQTGPDGKQYAVGGEVKVDASAVADNPDKTINKMQQVRRAALAPSDPSPQDRKVAAEASQTEAKASVEKSTSKNTKETKEKQAKSTYISKYLQSHHSAYSKLNLFA